MPAVTYIVSTYHRREPLLCCLASLRMQTDRDLEVIVADNSPELIDQNRNWLDVEALCDSRFLHVNSAAAGLGLPVWDCYHSAEWVVNQGLANGEWLCFPSDDSYYMPVFQETCLTAARANDWQLVFPEMLYDRRGSAENKYHFLRTAAANCQIDKTGFLLRRDVWIGFPDKPMHQAVPSCSDGAMIDRVVAAGARCGKVDEPLVIHN